VEICDFTRVIWKGLYSFCLAFCAAKFFNILRTSVLLSPGWEQIRAARDKYLRYSVCVRIPLVKENGTKCANARGSFRRVAQGERKLESRKNAKSAASSSGRWNRDRKRQRRVAAQTGPKERPGSRGSATAAAVIRFFFARTTLVYHASERPFSSHDIAPIVSLSSVAVSRVSVV